MNIAGLRVRINIQKNEAVTDQYGNHKSIWQDFFSCWATAVTSGLSTKEEESAGHTVEADRLDLTVRWSSERCRQFKAISHSYWRPHLQHPEHR